MGVLEFSNKLFLKLCLTQKSVLVQVNSSKVLVKALVMSLEEVRALYCFVSCIYFFILNEVCTYIA